MRTAMGANMAIDVQGRTTGPLCAKRTRGHPRARPGPLEIETADTSVDVENLSDEPQPPTHTRPHRRRIDFVHRDAARRCFGVVVAAIANHVQRPVDERMR